MMNRYFRFLEEIHKIREEGVYCSTDTLVERMKNASLETEKASARVWLLLVPAMLVVALLVGGLLMSLPLPEKKLYEDTIYTVIPVSYDRSPHPTHQNYSQSSAYTQAELTHPALQKSSNNKPIREATYEQ